MIAIYYIFTYVFAALVLMYPLDITTISEKCKYDIFSNSSILQNRTLTDAYRSNSQPCQLIIETIQTGTNKKENFTQNICDENNPTLENKRLDEKDTWKTIKSLLSEECLSKLSIDKLDYENNSRSKRQVNSLVIYTGKFRSKMNGGYEQAFVF